MVKATIPNLTPSLTTNHPTTAAEASNLFFFQFCSKPNFCFLRAKHQKAILPPCCHPSAPTETFFSFSLLSLKLHTYFGYLSKRLFPINQKTICDGCQINMFLFTWKEPSCLSFNVLSAFKIPKKNSSKFNKTILLLFRLYSNHRYFMPFLSSFLLSDVSMFIILLFNFYFSSFSFLSSYFFFIYFIFSSSLSLFHPSLSFIPTFFLYISFFLPPFLFFILLFPFFLLFFIYFIFSTSLSLFHLSLSFFNPFFLFFFSSCLTLFKIFFLPYTFSSFSFFSFPPLIFLSLSFFPILFVFFIFLFLSFSLTLFHISFLSLSLLLNILWIIEKLMFKGDNWIVLFTF